jgi:hypothetical protein
MSAHIDNMNLSSQEDIMLLAQIAEQCEQYDDMIKILKPYFETKDEDLQVEERNMLCVAYKNAVGLKRIAWRAVAKAKAIPKYDKFGVQISDYQKKLEEELVEQCKEMLTLISKHLMVKCKDKAES